VARVFKDKQILARVAVAAAGIALASALHYRTSPSLILWHNLFQRLYYLPIIYAAVYFGWRGGLAAAAVSAICYVPHIVMAWHHMPEYAMNQYAEIIVFFLVGTVAGVLADRERRQRERLESTTEELRRVNRDLQDSFEHLKRADRLSAIGQLSASLAHEIRNPLASIEGATKIVERPETSEEMRNEFLGIIRKESRRLNRLLTNLLDFSRPRRPEFQFVDVGTLLDSVITLAGHTAQQGGVELVKQLAGPAPAVESDPEQLKQVLLNLTINALQAMPEGGRIELSAGEREGSIVIAVRDQGQGIPTDELDRVFDPFYTTKETGTGLGLAVAHQIVTQHGGTLRAERNPDRGMTFSVTLPLHREVTA
jgi:two-component system sensor histidine kinase HydH